MTKPEITRIAMLALVVDEIVDAERFFEEAFDFVTLERRVHGPAHADLYGVPGVHIRETVMALDEQRIALLAFDPPGRPYPAGSTSSDLWFQHFAIIVSDMDKAYAGLVAAGRFTPITADGPVGAARLFRAASRPSSSAIPTVTRSSCWSFRPARDRRLGKRSAATGSFSASTIRRWLSATLHAAWAFFEAAFGLKLGPQSENVGPEQARMDAVPDARVTVSAMMPASAPPHVELLGYHIGTRRPIASATTSRDIAATHFVLETADLPTIVEALTRAGAHFVSPGVVTLDDGDQAIMVLDPDGHRFVVRQTIG